MEEVECELARTLAARPAARLLAQLDLKAQAGSQNHSSLPADASAQQQQHQHQHQQPQQHEPLATPSQLSSGPKSTPRLTVGGGGGGGDVEVEVEVEVGAGTGSFAKV